jgi:hypothetical protein
MFQRNMSHPFSGFKGKRKKENRKDMLDACYKMVFWWLALKIGRTDSS